MPERDDENLFCQACLHPERDKIDAQLARNVRPSTVGFEFKIDLTTVEWHYDRHVKRARVIRNDPHALLADLDWAKNHFERLFQWALRENKQPLAGVFLRDVVNSVVQIAKLTHADKALDPATYLPQWERIREKLLKVVEDNPQLRTQIIEALRIEDHSDNGRPSD